ncbi:MAG: response regulator [Alkalilacustris sp.]
MGRAHRGWVERLTQERRARLSAERLLQQRTCALAAARASLEIHARRIGNRIVAEREASLAAARGGPPPRVPASSPAPAPAPVQQPVPAQDLCALAERRLWATVEALEDGLAIFDADLRLLGANRPFLRLFSGWPEVTCGISHGRMLQICAEAPLVELGQEPASTWIAQMGGRLEQDPIPPVVLKVRDGPWLRLVDRRTRDGDLVCLALDVSDTVAMEDRLRIERDRAEAARRAKSVFLSNMSHEIRTPMNGIVGMAEMLCDTDLSDDQRVMVETIRASGESLLQMMNDILDFARTEDARMALHPEPFDLERCIHEILALQQPRAAERGLTLAVDYDLFLPTRLVADPGRIRQVLTHLVGNAVKFTAAGHVLVRVTGIETADGHCDVRLTVEDTGIGIAAEDLVQVFDGFTQVDAAENRRFEGTGLGLALTRRLIALMGGEIWVESEPGQGACFGLRLSLPVAEDGDIPRALPAVLREALVVDERPVNRAILARQLGALGVRVTACHAASEALRALDGGLRPDVLLCAHELPGMDGMSLVLALRARGWDGPVVLFAPNPAAVLLDAAAAQAVTVLQAPTPRRLLLRHLAGLGATAGDVELPVGAGPSPPVLRRRMRVLSAEDNRTNQLVLAKMLKDLDIELAFADDGETAVAMYGSFGPDLIFMDISMPGMDGREATRAIRAIERGTQRHVPIVALTANAPEPDAPDGLAAAGLDACLTKPLRRAAIAGCIARHAHAGVRPPLPDPALAVGT